jgi:hypothetical protein
MTSIKGPAPPRALAAPSAPGGATGVNQNPNSKQYGQTFVVQPTTGGVFHVYGNGQRIFVATSAVTPASGSAASQAAASQPTDPRDAQYYADSAQNVFDRNQKLSQLSSESTTDTTDHQEALRRLLERQGKDVLSTQESFNKQGLFYSGKLGEAQGNVNQSYARQQGDSELDYQRREAARQAARTALEQGASVDDASRLAEAIGRQVTRDTAAADAGALVSPEGDTAVETAQSAAQGRQTGAKFSRRGPASTSKWQRVAVQQKPKARRRRK